MAKRSASKLAQDQEIEQIMTVGRTFIAEGGAVWVWYFLGALAAVPLTLYAIFERVWFIAIPWILLGLTFVVMGRSVRARFVRIGPHFLEAYVDRQRVHLAWEEVAGVVVSQYRTQQQILQAITITFEDGKLVIGQWIEHFDLLTEAIMRLTPASRVFEPAASSIEQPPESGINRCSRGVARVANGNRL